MTNFTTYYPSMHRPSKISIICPKCSSHAQFNFSISRTADRIDRPYFDKSKSFDTEYVKIRKGQWNYRVWHNPGLGTPIENLEDLPESYKPIFSYQKCTANAENRGVVTCINCGLRRRHKLAWPQDAYFNTEYKGHALWAYNREMASILVEYLKSPERKKHKFFRVGPQGSWSWLRNLPKIFQSKKARPHVVKKLEKLLAL